MILKKDRNAVQEPQARAKFSLAAVVLRVIRSPRMIAHGSLPTLVAVFRNAWLTDDKNVATNASDLVIVGEITRLGPGFSVPAGPMVIDDGGNHICITDERVCKPDNWSLSVSVTASRRLRSLPGSTAFKAISGTSRRLSVAIVPLSVGLRILTRIFARAGPFV
jgi:hypothetical protein